MNSPILMSWMAISLGCAATAQDPTPVETPSAGKETTMIIRESTQGSLGDAEVGVSNIWEREYNLPDGSTVRGLTARLSLDEGLRLVVGKGSVIEVGGAKYEIISVVNPEEGLGSVEFKSAQ